MTNNECEKEKMELLDAKEEIESLKDSNSINKDNIKEQNKQILKMQEVVDEQNEIIAGVIKDITKIIEVAEDIPLQNKKISKKLPRDLN